MQYSASVFFSRSSKQHYKIGIGISYPSPVKYETKFKVRGKWPLCPVPVFKKKQYKINHNFDYTAHKKTTKGILSRHNM